MRRMFRLKSAWLVLLLLFPMVAVGGPLAPPDPPASTMKTIDEAAPGFPITRADIPLTITESGMYYFTEDLIVPAGVDAGIRVEAPNVTIDLRGFTLWGPGKDNPIGSTIGISASNVPDASNVRVMNGTVDGFNASGVTLVYSSIIEDMRVRNVRELALFADLGSIIRRCLVSESGSDSPNSRAISGNEVAVEDNVIIGCTAYRAVILVGGGVVRGNRVESCTLVYEGPASGDLASVDLQDIPAAIIGAEIAENNFISYPQVSSSSRWNAGIVTFSLHRVSGNTVEMARGENVIGILCRSTGTPSPVVENNHIQYPYAGSDTQIGIWANVTDARINGNNVVLLDLSTVRMDGILLMGGKNLVGDNEVTVDRRVEDHAGIRVLNGRNILTNNRITSLSVTSFATLRALSFEGDGSSGFSTNYYGGNIMEGFVFEEAGGGSSNIDGATPAPNVLY